MFIFKKIIIVKYKYIKKLLKSKLFIYFILLILKII